MLARLHNQTQRALAADEVKTRPASAGGQVLPATTEQWVAMLSSEKNRYEKLIREARIQPD